jgi:hypothetical protein
MKISSRESRNSASTRFPLLSLALLLSAALGGCGTENPEVTKQQALSERVSQTSTTSSVSASNEDRAPIKVDLTRTRELLLESTGTSIDLNSILIQDEDSTQQSLAAILGQSSLPVPGKGAVRIQIKDATPEQLTCGNTAAPAGCSERRFGSDSTTERCIFLGCNSRYCYWYCY